MGTKRPSITAGVTAAVLVLAGVVFNVRGADAVVVDPPDGLRGLTEQSGRAWAVGGTETPVPGLELTFSTGPFRWIRASTVVRVETDMAPATADVYLLRDGGKCGASSVHLLTSGGAGAVTTTVTCIDMPGDGSHTYSVSLKRTVGAGQVATWMTANLPKIIYAEDIGGESLSASP